MADAGRSASSEVTGLNQTKLGNHDSAFSKLALASPYADDGWRRLRLWFLNRLQEEPLEVGRGAPFLS